MATFLSSFMAPAVDFDANFVQEWVIPSSGGTGVLPEEGQTTFFNGGGYQFWQYFKNTAPITYVQYNGWYIKGVPAQGSYIASDKISDSARNLLCGIAKNAVQPTSGNCIWLQISGQGTVNVDGGQDLVLGDLVEPSSTDGQVTGVSAGTYPSYLAIGRCTAAGTKSNPRNVDLCILPA